jgi:hypothetical protein
MNVEQLNSSDIHSLSELGYNGDLNIYDIFNWFIIEKKLYPEIKLWSPKKNLWYFTITTEYGHTYTTNRDQMYFDYQETSLKCLNYLILLLLNDKKYKG